MINCPDKLTTRTADITTTNIIWNSVISTKRAQYGCIDVGDFYFETPMERNEYMKMALALFPVCTRTQYNLEKHALNGSVYWEICSAIYGLPNTGRFANLHLREKLKPAGFMK